MSDRDDFDYVEMARQADEYFANKEAFEKTRSLAECIKEAMANIRRRASPGSQESLDANALEAREVYALRDMPYRDYLETEHWGKLRNQVLTRDAHQCRDCGSRRNLHIHHLTYVRLGRERLDDLLTLCKGCHEVRHPEKNSTSPR